MHALWIAFTAVFTKLVKSQIGFWITSALAAFGMYFVVQRFAMGPAISKVQTAFGGVTGDVLAWVAFLKVD